MKTIHSDTLASGFKRIEERISTLEAVVISLRDQQTVRESYTTKELAQNLNRTEYTVREWCRLGRINAVKTTCGRGNEGEWRIPHSELVRYRKEGLLPLSERAKLRY
jgi:excisionase family DNA binding protein